MTTHHRFRTRRATAIAAFVLLPLAFVGVPTARAATTYHVDITGGSNTNLGTAIAPWQTLGHALNQLHAGDTLMVHGGTYRERIGCYTGSGASKCTHLNQRARNGLQGTSSNPIRVTAVPGERPEIVGVLWLVDFDYYVFDGINVTWDRYRNTTLDPAVKILNGRGWVFRNAEVKGAHSYSTFFIGGDSPTEPSSWRLTGNCIHDTYYTHPGFIDHNLYISGSEGTGIVERNIFYNATAGTNIKVAAAGASNPQPHNVTIRYNTLYNAAQNLLVGHSSRNIRVERNIVGRAIGKDWYPNLRGYYSTGGNVVAANNIGFSAARFIHNTDSTTGIRNGGGNRFPLNPKFDSTSSCKGFHPLNGSALRTGRYAGTPVAGHWAGTSNTDGIGWASLGAWRQKDDLVTGSADRAFTYGVATDAFVAGDWNDDGNDTAGLFRSGVWKLRDTNAVSSGLTEFRFGKPGDRPVVGDWDGDGVDSVGVVRGTKWYLRNGTSGPSDTSFSWGSSSDVPVSGDWDGDGVDTAGLFRPSTGTWYQMAGSDPTVRSSFKYGGKADKPVVGDWDGDGTDSPGRVLGVSWYLRNSNSAGSHNVAVRFDLA